MSTIVIAGMKKNGEAFRKEVNMWIEELSLIRRELISINLTPLTKCQELRSLSLFKNQLMEIDLAPLEKCSKLEKIDLRENQISSIDLTPISNCPILKIVRLQDNQLSSIDISSISDHSSFSICIDTMTNISWKDKNVKINQLPKRLKKRIHRKLILKGTTANGKIIRKEFWVGLTHLSLKDNQLSSIDLAPIRNCPNLKKINLEKNQLSSIDFNPMRNCPNLQTIDLKDNRLVSIDLTPIKNFPSLQTIDLKDNRLASIDLTPISNCYNLQKIYLDDSTKICWKGKTIKIDQLPERLQKCIHRKVIIKGTTIKGNEYRREIGTDIQKLSLKDLVEIDLSPLVKCSNLEKIKIIKYPLLKSDLLAIGKCPNLKRLDLSSNQLTEIDLIPLLKCKKLQELDLSNNWFESIDLTPLANHEKLQELDLSNNWFESIDLTPLAKCTRLKKLNLKENQLVAVDLSPLKNCRYLQKLPIDIFSTRICWNNANLDTSKLPYGLQKHSNRILQAHRKFLQQQGLEQEQQVDESPLIEESKIASLKSKKRLMELMGSSNNRIRFLAIKRATDIDPDWLFDFYDTFNIYEIMDYEKDNVLIQVLIELVFCNEIIGNIDYPYSFLVNRLDSIPFDPNADLISPIFKDILLDYTYDRPFLHSFMKEYSAKVLAAVEGKKIVPLFKKVYSSYNSLSYSYFEDLNHPSYYSGLNYEPMLRVLVKTIVKWEGLEAKDFLLKALTDGHDSIRFIALKALAKIPGEDVIEAIICSVYDNRHSEAAIGILVKRDVKKAVLALKTVRSGGLLDYSNRLHKVTTVALKKLGFEKTLPRSYLDSLVECVVYFHDDKLLSCIGDEVTTQFIKQHIEKFILKLINEIVLIKKYRYFGIPELNIFGRIPWRHKSIKKYKHHEMPKTYPEIQEIIWVLEHLITKENIDKIKSLIEKLDSERKKIGRKIIDELNNNL